MFIYLFLLLILRDQIDKRLGVSEY